MSVSLSILLHVSTVGVHNTEYQVDEEIPPTPTTSPTPTLHPDSVAQQDSPRMRTISSSPSSSFSHRSPGGLQDLESETIGEDWVSNTSPVLTSTTSGTTPGNTTATATATAAIKGRIGVSRVVGPESYYMGIVDFQQQYDISKKVYIAWYYSIAWYSIAYHGVFYRCVKLFLARVRIKIIYINTNVTHAFMH